MKHIWIVEWDTENFRFRAVGASPPAAFATAKALWETHKRQYRATTSWTKAVADYDIVAREVTLGVGYRDGEPVT